MLTVRRYVLVTESIDSCKYTQKICKSIQKREYICLENSHYKSHK